MLNYSVAELRFITYIANIVYMFTNRFSSIFRFCCPFYRRNGNTDRKDDNFTTYYRAASKRLLSSHLFKSVSCCFVVFGNAIINICLDECWR